MGESLEPGGTLAGETIVHGGSWLGETFMPGGTLVPVRRREVQVARTTTLSILAAVLYSRLLLRGCLERKQDYLIKV